MPMECPKCGRLMTLTRWFYACPKCGEEVHFNKPSPQWFTGDPKDDPKPEPVVPKGTVYADTEHIIVKHNIPEEKVRKFVDHHFGNFVPVGPKLDQKKPIDVDGECGE